MVRKLFWTNPYLTELDTHIASVDGDALTVEETIFYAFSGGQESDAGSIGGRRVIEARWEGREIVYVLESGHGLAVGDAVRMAIDWGRRYRLMRLHLAAELVLELSYRAFDGIEKIGAHISEDRARIDFLWAENIGGRLPEIQAAAQALIDADYPIISAWSDEANERRTWEVAGFARVACGGTHLRRTVEIGQIALRRENPGKGKERIEIRLIDSGR